MPDDLPRYDDDVIVGVSGLSSADLESLDDSVVTESLLEVLSERDRTVFANWDSRI